MTTTTAIVDLQFGSTGKGLIAGYLSERKPYDTVVSANMPNAGHTFVNAWGDKTINKVLPSGVYSKTLKNVGIGPGAIFDPERLVKEINWMRERIDTHPRILIHEGAALLRPEHTDKETIGLNHIASTMQGSAEAMIEKIRREGFGGNVVQFCMEELDKHITQQGGRLSDYVVSSREWNRAMIASSNILVEGSQGYSLGINAGFYPYCTSRDCTVWRLLADCAVPVTSQRIVVGTARVHPIRVGNVQGGNSGPVYGDQEETSWEALGQPPEMTTVTGRVRRVFTFSATQVHEAIYASGVDQVFLNFCNYNPQEAIRVTSIINKIGADAFKYRNLGAWQDEAPQFVRYMGFGPQSNHIMEHKGYID